MTSEKKPTVSILVVAYNQEAYIAQTLDSLLSQECSFPFEILVGEDCSTDDTLSICQSYAAKHHQVIRLFANKRNKGLVNNYFDLFELATGTYLADCGGDDFWLGNDRLQRQVNLLEAHPEISMVTGNTKCFHEVDGSWSSFPGYREESWFQPDFYGKQAVAEYLSGNGIPRFVLSASCLRGSWARELYQTHREWFRGREVVCEDLPLLSGMLLKGPVLYESTEWLAYRILEKSLSHSVERNEFMNGFAFSAYAQTLKLAEGMNLRREFIMPYAMEQAGNFALHAFLQGNPELMDRLRSLLAEHRIPVRFRWNILHLCMRNPRIHDSAKLWYKRLRPGNQS